MERRIRTLAVAVIRRDDTVLVFERRDTLTGEVAYRLLGGGIEFGESGIEAVVRELREEIGAELDGVRYLGALEHRFDFEGEPRHEIALVYEASLRDPALYDRDTWRVEAVDVLWKRLTDFADGADRLWPDGVLEMIEW
jgi:8-oxo-dGTP pyrophosphatase MutT (NUDIX family)